MSASSPSPQRSSQGLGQPKSETESVKVAVRVRPFNQREQASSQIPVIRMSMKRRAVYITPPSSAAHAGQMSHRDGAQPSAAMFEFDHVFWSMSEPDMDGASPSTQAEVYNQIGKPLVSHAFNGFNSCLFAYGQTGSGKTHSMMGGSDMSSEERGVIPRLAQELFEEKAAREAKTGSTWSIEFGFVEVYNEKVSDLLAPRKKEAKGVDIHVEVREDVKKGIFIQNQTLAKVHSFQDVMNMIDQGNLVRHVAATKMNARSSRSHAIVQILLSERRTIKLTTGQTIEAAGVQSRVNLVDLAGSERVSQSQVVGEQFNEAKFINLSLTTLGRVIDMLADMARNENSKWTKPPYRESKLTFILKDSLGGNSKTFMIATVSPSDMNYDESHGTLRYASRAREIVNTAKVNEDPQARKIREMEEQMEEMRQKLQFQGSDPEFVSQLQEKLRQMESETSKRAAEMEMLRLQKEQAEKQTQMLRATEEERAKLQKEADVLAKQLADANENERLRQEELERIRDEHLQREQEMRERLESRDEEIQQMQRQLSEMNQTSVSLQKTMTELEEERRSKEEALQELADKQKAVQQLLTTTQEASEQRRDLEEKNAKLLAEISEKQAQQESHERLLEELHQIRNQNEKSDENYRALQRNYELVLLSDDERSTRSFLEVAYGDLFHETAIEWTQSFLQIIDLLETQNFDLRNDYDTLAQGKALDLQQIDTLDNELSATNDNITKLKLKLDSYTESNTALMHDIDSLTKAKRETDDELAALTEAKRATDDELAALRASSTTSAAEATAKIEQLGSEVAALTEAKRATDDELAALRASTTTSAADATAKIEQLGSEVAALVDERSALERSAKDHSHRLSKEVKTLAYAKEALGVRLNALRREVEKHRRILRGCYSCREKLVDVEKPVYAASSRAVEGRAAQ